MDSPISQSQQTKDRRWRIFRLLLIVPGLVFAAMLFRYLLRPSAESASFRFATVEQGEVENAISTTGLVVPAYEQLLTSPITARLNKVLHRAGTSVKTGELILELDEEYTRLQYEQLGDELELRKTNVTSLKLTYDKDLRDLELRDQIKALQLSRLEAQLADARQLQAVGGTAKEEVKQAELALQIARLEKSQLENELAYRKESLASDRLKLELEVQIQEKRLAELARKLNETRLRAPNEGVITWINEDIGKNIAEGEALVRLSNLSGFRIEGTGSDLYADRIRVGLPVKVRINREVLPGLITSIAPAVEQNSLQFQVTLENPSAEALRPNMQVEVYVITDRKADALRVVNGPAFTGAKEQDIFVVEGDLARKQRVKVGLNSLEYVELQGNIRPGDKIILSDMRDYQHLDQIKLKP
ncbi:MAG: HlyD family efflux transporter periplasmic adaptor subunit [Bacteroidia bacterium]|nr:HlyD family efflux transporter periplasmic adaptor subunit [Bacteroidia bacterium]